MLNVNVANVDVSIINVVNVIVMQSKQYYTINVNIANTSLVNNIINVVDVSS